MQKLNTNHGYHTLSRVLRFLELRLARFPELAEFRDIVVALRKNLAQDQGAFAEAQEQRIAASAEIAVLDDGVDALAITISQGALALFDRNREDPRYKQAFPVSASNMVSGQGGDRQERFMANLCVTLKTVDAYAPLRDKGQQLERLLEQLKQAQARRQDLWQQEAALGVKYQMTAEATRREYNALYHHFMIRMPDRATELETLFLRLAPSTHATPAGADGPGADDPSLN